MALGHFQLIPSIFKRKKRTFVVNEPEAVHNVIYLGNVLTIMAKGDGCYDKPLALIWKTYCSKTRPDLPMVLSITRSGLQAQTKQQGITEYWAHRITFCSAPPNYPKVFVWIYKHEGKRMKPELRCHAILCKKPEVPGHITIDLQGRIQMALREYRREKLTRQNIRLSEMTVGHPAIPKRKILLTATTNFRPPMNKSRSAPKLGSIEEDSEEEEMDEENVSGTEMSRMFLVMEEDDLEADCSPSPSSSDCSNSVGNSPVLGTDATRLDGFSYSSSLIPGTPSELEFADQNGLNADQLAQSLAQLDIAVPNSQTLNRCNSMTRRFSGNHKLKLLKDNSKVEPDSVSDESGYHEDKSPPEELDPQDFIYDQLEIKSEANNTCTWVTQLLSEDQRVKISVLSLTSSSFIWWPFHNCCSPMSLYIMYRPACAAVIKASMGLSVKSS